MPDLEGVGEAVTGAMLGGAVEPRTGEIDDGHTHESNCLNCGCALTGDYCHCCGQRAHVHRTLRGFLHDLVHGVFHFEGKIWHTLPLLAWRPGELTRRYVDGQRARFVSPIALFLFSVFLMFAVFSLVGGPFSLNDTSNRQNKVELEQDYQKARADSLSEIAELQKRREALVAAGSNTAALDADIRNARRGMEIQETIFSTMGRRGTEAVVRDPAAVVDVDTESLDGSLGWFEDAYRSAKENPSLLFYKLQTNAYKFSWALIPISVPFVWLLFLHRRRYRREYRAYDHTVFVTYSIAFMSLGVIALSLARPIGLPEVVAGLAMMIVPPVHMYRQLKGAYRLSRFSALWRTVALLFFTAVTVTLFAAALLLMGVLG